MTDTRNHHTEFRRCHLGGAVYLAVEAFLWLLSSGLGAAGRKPAAMLALLAGGMLIHPLAAGASRLLRLPPPHRDNPLALLTTWVSLTIPLGLPLIFMATRAGGDGSFYPAFAVLIGAHWLPFAHIYGMKSFLPLAGLMVAGGIFFGFVAGPSFSACGFYTGGLLLVFAAIQYLLVRREFSRNS